MPRMTWRFVSIAYFVFYLAVIWFEGRGFRRESMSATDLILTVPFCWGFVLYSVQSGYVPGRFGSIDRADSPVKYWIIVAFFFLLGLFLLGSGIGDTGGALRGH